MSDDDIKLPIGLEEDKSVGATLARIEEQVNATAGKIDKDLKKGGGGVKQIAAGVAIGEAAFKAFDKVVSFTVDSFKEAINISAKYENSVKSLSAALVANGSFNRAAIEGAKEFADQLERTTGINESVILSNQAVLASVGNLSGKGLNDATKAATALAATGKDLEGVTFALAKATDGSTEGLRKFGIKIDENVPKSERFAFAISEINRRFGALAEARTSTFEGALNSIGNGVEKIMKVFGDLITQSPVVRAILKTTGEIFNEIGVALGSFFKGKDPFGDLLKGAINFSMYLSKNVLPILEVFFNFFKTGALVISTFATGVTLAFVKIQKFFLDYVMVPITRFFTDGLASLVEKFSAETAQKLRAMGEKIITVQQDASAKAVEVTSKLFETSGNALIDSANSVLETKTSESITNILGRYQTAIENFQPPPLPENTEFVGPVQPQVFDTFGLLVQGANEQIADLNKNFQKNFMEMGKTMVGTLGNGAANAFAAFGRALVQGKNALASFGQAMLAAFGNAAVQLGSLYIIQGIAMTLAYNPQGPPLIVQGAVLAAAGGALAALGGGGGGSSVGSTSVPGPGSVGDINSTELNPTVEDQTPKSQITLNVNGDVFDSNDTGLRMVDLLRQYGDKNGAAVLT